MKYFHKNHYRASQEKEHRLIANVPSSSPENIDEVPAVERVETSTTDQQLDALLEQIEGGQDMEAVRTQIEQIDAAERDAALERLEARIDQHATTEAQKNALRAKINELKEPVTKVHSETTPIEKETFVGKTKAVVGHTTEVLKHELTAIKEDFVNGSNWTKAGYIAGGVVGFLAARWLWRKAREMIKGKDSEEGAFSKIGKWFVGIGAGVAGFLGFKALRDKWKDPLGLNSGEKPFFDRDSNNPFVPDSVEPTVEGGIEGAQEGFNDAYALFGNAASSILKHEHTAQLFKEKDSYTSNLDFTGALLVALTKDGYDYIVDGTTVSLYVGSELVPLTGKFGEQAWNYFVEGNRTPETTGDMVATYIEGSMVYASSLLILKAMTLNRVGAGAKVLLETGLWPIYTVKRGAQGGFVLLRGAGELLVHDSGTRLTLQRIDATLSRNIRLRGGRWLSKLSIDGLKVRHDFALQQIQLLERAGDSRLAADPKAMHLFEANTHKAIDEFATYIKSMNKADLPQEFLDAYAKVSDLDLEKLPRSEWRKIIGKMSGISGVADKSDEAVETAVDGFAAVRKSPFLKQIIEKTGAKLDDVLQMLAKIDVPPSVLEAFARSKGAMIMLFNASKNGLPGVQYLTKLGSFIQKFGPALGVATAGALEVGLCALDIAMNKERIANTDNVDLKELYALRDNMSYANAAVGGGMILTSSWAPAGAVVSASALAPALIVGLAAREAHDRLEQTSETWLKTETDWSNESSGKVREELKELAPGDHGYWQNAAGDAAWGQLYNWLSMDDKEYADHEQKIFDRIEDANSSARVKLTRAYLAQMTELIPEEGETQEQFEKRFAQFQLDQVLFMADQTQGSFSLQLNDVYRNAHTHAELKALSRKLKDCNGSQMITVPFSNERGEQVELTFDLAKYDEFKNLHDRIDGVSAMSVLHAYRQQQRGMAMLQSAFLKESGSPNSHHQRDFILQRTMLMEVRHELAQCDQALRTADLEGWEWTGGEGETRDHMRYVMNVEFRKMLRAESDRLQELTLATPSDLEESVNRLKSYLQQPTQTFVQMSEKGTYGGAAEFSGQSEVLSDIGWNMENLYVYPPSKETPSNT